MKKVNTNFLSIMGTNLETNSYSNDLVILDGHGSFFQRKANAPAEIARELSTDGAISEQVNRLLKQDDFIFQIEFWRYLHLVPCKGVNVLDQWEALLGVLGIPSKTMSLIEKQIEDDSHSRRSHWRNKEEHHALFQRYIKHYEIREGWLDHFKYLRSLGVSLVLCSSIPSELSVQVGMILENKDADQYFGTDKLLPRAITRRSGKSLEYKRIAHNIGRLLTKKRGGRVQSVDDDPQVAYYDLVDGIPCYVPMEKTEALQSPRPSLFPGDPSFDEVINQVQFDRGILDVVDYYKARVRDDRLSGDREVSRIG